MIPSKFYLHFLKYVVGWFNRDLDKHVTEEDKEEIYGISLSASTSMIISEITTSGYSIIMRHTISVTRCKILPW